MRGLRSWFINAVMTLYLILLSGCGTYLPGFDGVFGIESWIHDMPVREAVSQVQCELSDFLMDPSSPKMLAAETKDKQKAFADVTLWLQTDTMGNVQYVGVDLRKVGLAGVANLIAISNKAPSLQVSGQGTATIKSQLDLQIPQRPLITGYKENCQRGSGSKLSGGNNLIVPLALKSFLLKFFDKYQETIKHNPSACLNKLTLSTQFALVFDVKAGVNPLVGSTFILPVSGVNGEVQPKFTHLLQVTFYLERPNGANCPDSKVPGPNPRV
jgi:hypothetical protein